jgi:hypothetical protein
MRFRYAAALLLVGWYLLIPPQAHGGPFDLAAPLSHWLIYGRFDSLHECEHAKALNRETFKAPDDPLKEAFEHAQCVATNDPRLAR